MFDVNQSLYIRALRRKPVDRTPLWIMRQAGRYLPEYRKTRELAGDFLSLCKNPELACEVTLQPLRRYELDAAILFSDILTIPDAMGLGLYFSEGEGPCFERPVRDEPSIQRLEVPCMQEKLGYVMDAARLIRKEMPQELPLIGFSGSPWTLACYMVEGGSSKEYKRILQMMYEKPALVHGLLNKLSTAVSLYLVEQIKAGVDAVMIFDTWGGILTPQNYRVFSLHYMQNIVQSIKQQYPNTPITLFTKNGGMNLAAMADTGCNALGVDWTCDLQQARQQVGHQVALQGNLDPAVLRTNRDTIRQQVEQILTSFGHGSGHVFNLGHGITPDVPPENVAYLVEAVREFSPKYHGV